MTKSNIRMTGEYQSKVDTFVYKEVLTSANQLIQALNASDLREGEYSEELIELTGSNDYLEPAIYEIENATDLSEYTQWFSSVLNADSTELLIIALNNLDDSDIQAFCDHFGIEPQFNEVLEHWIVSDHLANKLREHDQIVADIYGLTIWGRYTSGQAISMDGVICDIYDELNN